MANSMQAEGPVQGAQPNIVIILCDDMGFSDPGCFGGEMDTPNIDRLAQGGVRFTQFYSAARCAPSRASLLTGLHPHQTGIGILTYDDGPDGYPGNLCKRCVTIAELLRADGYRTYLSGKWHLAKDSDRPNDTWPLQRGFDRFFGTIVGSGSYYTPHTLTRDNESCAQETRNDDFYYTDAISDEAVRFIREHERDHPDKPFFQYVAYTAPHWPLHAPEADIAKYRGRFDRGWDVLREERFERMKRMGIVDAGCRLSERDPAQPTWEEADNRGWLLRCMEVYAAQVDRMDQGIGRILSALEEAGRLENTLLVFLSDNGGCNEQIHPHPEPGTSLLQSTHTRTGEPVLLGNHPEVMPGPENTFQTYGPWANLSNTPFRRYKSWVHEGGIATPLIVHWPARIRTGGRLCRSIGQLTDMMATIVEATGAEYPAAYDGNPILPMEGRSLLPALLESALADADAAADRDAAAHPVVDCAAEEERALFWEHQGNGAVRLGDWKLVKSYPDAWELYDLSRDRTETTDVSAQYPEQAAHLRQAYEAWTERCGVIARERILAIPGRKHQQSPYFGWMI